jgi:hypothetical protein
MDTCLSTRLPTLTSWGRLLGGRLAPGELPPLDARQAGQLLCGGQGWGRGDKLRSGTHKAAQLQASGKGSEHLGLQQQDRASMG